MASESRAQPFSLFDVLILMSFPFLFVLFKIFKFFSSSFFVLFFYKDEVPWRLTSFTRIEFVYCGNVNFEVLRSRFLLFLIIQKSKRRTLQYSYAFVIGSVNSSVYHAQTRLIQIVWDFWCRVRVRLRRRVQFSLAPNMVYHYVKKTLSDA